MKDVHKMTLAEYEIKVGMGKNGEYDGEEIIVEAETNTINVSSSNRATEEDEDISASGEEIILQGEAPTNIAGYPSHEGR
jgi:hypothetical protein